jgi:hypothetical protein
MNRLRTGLVVLLAANAVLIFFLFRAPGASETDRRAEIARLEAEERATRERVEQLRSIKSKVLTATENEQQFSADNFLRRSSAASQMMDNLDGLARKNGLDSSGVNWSNDEKANGLGWTSVTATMSVEGEYANLVRFINELEKSQLFWIIESLSVSGQAGTRLRLDLQAATYLLPS